MRPVPTASFCYNSWPSRCGRQGCRGGNRDVAEIADRTEHLAAMAEQDTEVFQVLVCQIGENAGVDPVLHEASGVLGQAKRRQPLCDRRHNLGPRRIPATLYPKEAIQALFFGRSPSRGGMCQIPRKEADPYFGFAEGGQKLTGSGSVGAKVNLAVILHVCSSANTRGRVKLRCALSARCFAMPIKGALPKTTNCDQCAINNDSIC